MCLYNKTSVYDRWGAIANKIKTGWGVLSEEVLIFGSMREDDYIEEDDLEWDPFKKEWVKSDRKYRNFTVLKPYSNARDGDNYDLFDEWNW